MKTGRVLKITQNETALMCSHYRILYIHYAHPGVKAEVKGGGGCGHIERKGISNI